VTLISFPLGRQYEYGYSPKQVKRSTVVQVLTPTTADTFSATSLLSFCTSHWL